MEKKKDEMIVPDEILMNTILLIRGKKEEVVAFCDHLESLKYSPVLPYVFTEYGAVMLASVLNIERAIVRVDFFHRTSAIFYNGNSPVFHIW